MTPEDRTRRRRPGGPAPEAAPGLKVHSRRGRIGRTWWSLRWTTVLESIGLGDRLHRGRSLARAGHVLSLEISRGTARAQVRGQRGEQHSIEIRLAPIAAPVWEILQEILARRALFAARLLSGEMPESIEEAFAEAGLSLFPEASGEVEVECDCSDPASPCPHAAAVFYLMAERFDQDPFQILLFRGQGREEFLDGLKRRWSGGTAAEGNGKIAEEAGAEERPAAPAAASSGESAGEAAKGGDLLPGFWNLSGELDAVVPRIQPPAIPEAVLRRLGPPPGAVTGSPADLALRKAYRTASEWALKLALKETGHEA
jgi:uncharacterized Zn finger protein